MIRELQTVEGFLLALGISLLPVYVFSSGGVQPSHLILAIFSGSVLLRYSLPLAPWAICLGLMFVYTLVVESVYVLSGKNPGDLINAVFFLYNYILVSAIYQYCLRRGLSAVTVGVTASALLAVATVLVSGVDLRGMDSAGRETGSFNNPNQLGYFSVCILAIAYVLYRHLEYSYKVAAVFFAFALFLSIVSLSKAALLSNLFVIVFVLKPAVSRRSVFTWLAGVAAAAALIGWLYAVGAFDDYLFMQRLYTMDDEADSSLAARGYFAMTHASTLQLFFGLGTGNVDDILGHEVHSTLGSVVNEYGIVGLVIFSAVLLYWFRGLLAGYGFFGLICVAAPVMLYGVTHNGTRFTIFWILVAVSFAMARRDATLVHLRVPVPLRDQARA